MSAPAKAMNRRERRAVRKAVTEAIETKSVISLVASAANVRVTANWVGIRWGSTEWEQEAWLHYDSVPEFHEGVGITARNLSRSRLIGVEVDPITGELGTQPTDDPDVADIMGQLFGGATGQSQALAAISRHLDVAGACWAFATDNPDVDADAWEILSTADVTGTSGGRIQITQLNGLPRPLDEENEFLMRMWQPHPKRRWEADSAARSLLPVLREIAALTAMVSATVKSRLASAGILWIPEEITLPTRKSDAPNDNTQVRSESAGAAGWLDLITEAMTTPIRDPDSASAVVPLVAVVKGAHIKDISHMEFGRDLDAVIEPLREACVKRLAVGLNLPSSILLGLESANHWTAWTITEDYARAYIAPKLELIADAVTKLFLRPALRDRGKDPRRYAVGFDLDKLLPNTVTVDNAEKAYAAGVLKEERYMAVLGFSTSDIADNRERARRLITELLARGNPQTLAEVAQTIAILFPGIEIQPINPTTGGMGKPIAGAPGQPAAPAQNGAEPKPAPTRASPPQLPAGGPPSAPDTGATGA